MEYKTKEIEDFIVSKLKGLSINNLFVRYAYDSVRDVHVIEVSPDSIRFKDETFINFEFDFWDEFFEKYPEANMYFSCIDDYNNMENVLYNNADDKKNIIDDINFVNDKSGFIYENTEDKNTTPIYKYNFINNGIVSRSKKKRNLSLAI